jgi:hypothetical protein
MYMKIIKYYIVFGIPLLLTMCSVSDKPVEREKQKQYMPSVYIDFISGFQDTVSIEVNNVELNFGDVSSYTKSLIDITGNLHLNKENIIKLKYRDIEYEFFIDLSEGFNYYNVYYYDLEGKGIITLKKTKDEMPRF